MKNLVLKGHSGVSTLSQILLHALQSREFRACSRYFNTVAIFLVVGLIFSNEFSSTPKTQLSPIQDVKEKNYYAFPLVKSSFGKFDLRDVQYYSKEEFRSLVLASVPGRLKLRLGRYLKTTMELCEKHQVDPFWAISVMWTESHFNFKAKSSVSASGLMQIMPATGEFLSRLMKMPQSKELTYRGVTDPKINIEMGVFYLKRLLRIFDGNHVLATVAYNMGPGGVFKRQRLKLPVGVRNLYLDKVRRYYSFVTREFIYVNKKLKSELSHTLVVRFPKRGYLYTKYNELDEVFQFVEIPRFGPKIAFLSERHKNKSL